MSKWEPDWELCEDGQCDFPDVGKYGTSAFVILQRCRTEDGNWLYMAVSTGERADEGGVALTVEHVSLSGRSSDVRQREAD